MGTILQNPDVSLRENIGAPILYYIADGAAIFGCIGDPNGVITANARSVALSDDGNIYYKTTNNVATGWVAVAGGGGGGGGTVTSVGLSGNAIFDLSGSSSNPIVGAGTFDLDFVAQTANKVFASASSGGAAIPTFRALVNADLSLAAAPPSGGIQYNNGANGITASNGLKFDFSSNTEQIGESTVLKGTTQHFAQLSAGSVKHTVNNPASNYTWIWGDSLPVNNDLLRVSVSGANITVNSIAASALGFASVNPTSGIIPYNNAGSFADSPLRRIGSLEIGFGNSANDVAIKQENTFTNNTLAVMSAGTTFAGNFICRTHYYASVPNNVSTIIGGFAQANNRAMWNTTFEFNWTSTPNGSGNPIVGTADVGLTRRTTNVLRLTNGSTAAGTLLVGSSTDTAQGYVHSQSPSTIVPAFYAIMPNGSSGATFKAETNGIQSFAFMPSGKLIGGMNSPTSNQQFSAIGNAKSETTGYGSISTTLTNLANFTLIGNALANNGDYLEQDAFGEFENNANNKQLTIVYGATTIFDTTALPFGTAALANWRINLKIVRTGASSQKCIVTFWSNDGTTSFLQTYTPSGEDMTTNKTIQYKGQGTTTNDVYQEYLETRLCVALTS